jgi:transcriptional regulator with XRE-family HTH domain
MSLSAELLKESRLKQNLSQNDVAAMLNVSRQTISRWETGRGYPETDNLVKLSHIYQISLEDLFKNDEITNVAELSSPAIPITNDPEATKDDSMIALILLCIALIIPVLGIFVFIYIWRTNTPVNRYNRVIKVLCIIGILINLYSSYNVFDAFFPMGGTTIQKIK